MTERQEDLNSFFLELFTPEFLESLPPEQIERVIINLTIVEETANPIPPQWKAIKSVLQTRGYLSVNK